MIHLLKHLAFRLWFAVFGSSLISLWLLSKLGPFISLWVPVAVVLSAALILLWIGGRLSDPIGLSLLRPYVSGAGIWERKGMGEKAADQYAKAIAMTDSFLLTPATRRRILPDLIGRMARFYLAAPDAPPQTHRIAKAYLGMKPDDEAFARAWLDRLEAIGALHLVSDDEVSRIGNAHPRNPQIQESLSRRCLKDRRTDFLALHTYRRLIEAKEAVPPEMIDQLAQLFLEEGRADEWALRVYLQAAGDTSVPESLVRGIAACRRWLMETPRNRPLLHAADRHLSDRSEADLIRMSAGFLPPGALDTPAPVHPEGRDQQATPRIKAVGLRLEKMAGRATGVISRTTDAFGHKMGSPPTLNWLRWGFGAALTVSAVVLLINTAGYLRPVHQEPPRSDGTPGPAKADALYPPGGGIPQIRLCQRLCG